MCSTQWKQRTIDSKDIESEEEFEMFSRVRKVRKAEGVTFCDGDRQIMTPERRATRVVDEARTWALSHR